MSDSDGIEVRIGSYANLIVQPSAYIDCSHMTDEEFAAMQAERCPHDQTDIYGTHDIACDAFLPDGECSCGKVRRRCCECGVPSVCGIALAEVGE